MKKWTGNYIYNTVQFYPKNLFEHTLIYKNEDFFVFVIKVMIDYRDIEQKNILYYRYLKETISL